MGLPFVGYQSSSVLSLTPKEIISLSAETLYLSGLVLQLDIWLHYICDP
jgi:hypothetical protein